MPVYGEPQWLEELRLLLLVGFASTVLLWIAMEWEAFKKLGAPPDPKKPSKTPSNYYCRKHGVNEDECYGKHLRQPPEDDPPK